MTLFPPKPELKVFDDIVKEEQKFCIHCQNIATNGAGNWETYRCMALENFYKLNLVTGNKVYKFEFCIESRKEYSESCGEAGKWFKKKEKIIPYNEVAAPVDFGAQDLTSLSDAAAKRVAELKNKKKKNDWSNL